MKKILILANIILFLSGCATPQENIEKHKSFYIGKQVALEESIGSASFTKPVKEWDLSAYKISDVEYTYNVNNSVVYNILLSDKDNKNVRKISIQENDLTAHRLPYPLMDVESDYYKKLVEEKQRWIKKERAKNEIQNKIQKRAKQLVTKFREDYPAWKDLIVTEIPFCPLSSIVAAGANPMIECQNIDIKNKGKKLYINMSTCTIGDISLVFQYGTKFAVPEQITAMGQTHYSMFSNLKDEAYSYCSMGFLALTGNKL